MRWRGSVRASAATIELPSRTGMRRYRFPTLSLPSDPGLLPDAAIQQRCDDAHLVRHVTKAFMMGISAVFLGLYERFAWKTWIALN